MEYEDEVEEENQTINRKQKEIGTGTCSGLEPIRAALSTLVRWIPPLLPPPLGWPL